LGFSDIGQFLLAADRVLKRELRSAYLKREIAAWLGQLLFTGRWKVGSARSIKYAFMVLARERCPARLSPARTVGEFRTGL
jgi:hypothetical protein